MLDVNVQIYRQGKKEIQQTPNFNWITGIHVLFGNKLKLYILNVLSIMFVVYSVNF